MGEAQETCFDRMTRETPGKCAGEVFVCDRCKAVFGHHVVYCPGCPGRCVPVRAGTYAELAEGRAGYEWGETLLWRGEESKVRWAEHLEERKKSPIPARVVYWVHRNNAAAFWAHMGFPGEPDPRETFEPNVVELSADYPDTASAAADYRKAKDKGWRCRFTQKEA